MPTMRQPNTSTHIGRTTAVSQTSYLVFCVSRKRATTCQARDLYTSPWSIKARAHVEALSSAWFILSAARGLLQPDRRIAPYDVTLPFMSAPARRAWATRVQGSAGGHSAAP